MNAQSKLLTEKTMQKTCSKCGELTDYDSDLHCREILRAETKQLLLCGKIKEAEHLVSQAQFNEEWKQVMLRHLFLEPEINQEVQEFRRQQRLEISLAPLPGKLLESP